MNPANIMHELEDQDLFMALELEKFLASPLGQYLKKQWSMKREALLFEGKKAMRDQGDKFWGMLEGFDRAVVMPHEIIETVKKHKRLQEEEVLPDGAF